MAVCAVLWMFNLLKVVPRPEVFVVRRFQGLQHRAAR